jgi:hypothetical protein
VLHLVVCRGGSARVFVEELVMALVFGVFILIFLYNEMCK